jgi:hypothetical protein
LRLGPSIEIAQVRLGRRRSGTLDARLHEHESPGAALLFLLALRFEKKGEGPEGTIELSLSGTASIALDVECIEVQLADIGGAWEASSKPRHL